MTDAQIYAARRQGKLEGLREAARVVCRQCRRGAFPVERTHVNGRWFHAINPLTEAHCKASAIHDLIAKDWGTIKPERNKR